MSQFLPPFSNSTVVVHRHYRAPVPPQDRLIRTTSACCERQAKVMQSKVTSAIQLLAITSYCFSYSSLSPRLVQRVAVGLSTRSEGQVLRSILQPLSPLARTMLIRNFISFSLSLLPLANTANGSKCCKTWKVGYSDALVSC